MAFEPVPFGKYTLYEKLAVGGMAIIYRARIQGVKGFQKDLVIKQILPQYSGMNDFIDMFIDEAKISVNLNHANIVPVYELGEIDGQLYIAMEYVAGKDLQSILEQCDEKKILVPARVAAYVMIGVCRGLDYAHNKRDDATRQPLNIIHRDISPNNVIVGYEGDVKIIDFGIAKASIKVSVTQFGTLKGKMIYMSPEQAAEKPLDARSDVFSAGILLYEMVTGKKPYGGDNFVQTQDNVRKALFPPPSQVNPALPKAIDEIIMKAMAREPEARFESAFEFERALSDFLFSTGKNVYARDVSQFVNDLFAEGTTPADAVPRPGEASKVPTITNIRNLSSSATANPNAPTTTGEGAAAFPTNGGPSLTPTEEHSLSEPGLGPGSQLRTDGGANAPFPAEAPQPTASFVDVPDEGGAIVDDDEFANARKVPPPDAPPDQNPTPPPNARGPVASERLLDVGDFEIPPPPAAQRPSEAQRDTVITKLPGRRPPGQAPDLAGTPPPATPARDGVVPARFSAQDTSRTSPSSPSARAARAPAAAPPSSPSWSGPDVLRSEPPEGVWDDEDSIGSITDRGAAVIPERQLDEETAPGQLSREAREMASRAAEAARDALARAEARGTAEPKRGAGAGAPPAATPGGPRKPSPTAPGAPGPAPAPAAKSPRTPPSNPASMQSPPRGTPAPAKDSPAPPWERAGAPSQTPASSAPASAAAPDKAGLLSRIAKSVGGRSSPSAAAAAMPVGSADLMLEGQYDTPQDFLANAYATYGDRRGLFLTTKQLDTKLGVDIPLDIDFASPPARFQVHGRVIWRRAKEGTSKGKKLPAGLAIEFVDGLPDDLEALFAYLGLP